MSQQIRVLRCFNCDLFQTDIVKKSNKWQCKTCYTKQIVRREYIRGCGAACRAKVQQFNMRSGEQQKIKNDNLLELLNSDDVDEYEWDVIASVERKEEPNQEHKRAITIMPILLALEMMNKCLTMYSNTQKWSRADPNTVKVPKKSKWESYS